MIDRDRLRLRAIVVSTNDALAHEFSEGVTRRIHLEADRLLTELERDVREGQADGALLEDIERARSLVRAR